MADRAVNQPATTSAAATASDRVLSTLNADGSRRWLKPRPAPGRFLTARRVVAWGLIALFTLIPHIRVGGAPLVLLDLPTRRFVIFGATFLPSDTLLLALLMVGIFLTVFFLTALLGRVWCGWGCPQTVYLEFVYRPVGRFFDGTPGRRRRSWQGSGPAMVAKYLTFLAISCFLAHTFIAYFVDVQVLWTWMRMSPIEHPAPFLVMAAVTALMMADFSFFREQICILACPYGRFQSVMLDRQSLIVSYDTARGEPRRAVGHDASAAAPESAPLALPIARHGERDDAPRSRGDCVACSMCVTCCPTGIDIRDGLQMECVGCAQCIDACDAVMDRIGKPRGLIRYSSQAAMEGGKVRLLRPRVILYPLVLLAVITAFVTVLLGAGGPQVAVLRGLGPLFTEPVPGVVANTVRVRLVARDPAPVSVSIALAGAVGLNLVIEENPVTLEPRRSTTVPITVEAPRDAFRNGQLRIDVVISADSRTRVVPFTMQGPRRTTSSIGSPDTTIASTVSAPALEQASTPPHEHHAPPTASPIAPPE